MELSKWEFPCVKQCIVSPCCKIYCYRVFDYANMIADQIYTMTEDALKIHRKSTPRLVRRKIMELYINNKRLTFPESSTISRKWN